MQTQLKLTVLAAAMLLSTTAMATAVDITNVSASWSNAIASASGAGAPLTFAGGTLNPYARWGVAAGGSGQSGYNFGAVANPFNASVTPGDSSALFALGTFAHVNQPVTGSSITSIDLLYQADIIVNGTPVATNPLNFDFVFNHNETPNGDNPCANGAPNNVPLSVNASGCADHVQTAFSGVSDTFFINGANYTLNILGFGYLDASNNLVKTQDFWTAEGAVNTATLYAEIVTTTNPGGTGLTSVPEPSGLMLMGLGLAAFLGKRRKQHC
ncbi:MAG: PEP-CTERM sorting domain-containing protein [Methylococcales bacterium]|nr:MAG: PEP-CTERM sorting domain-containing protein [Methylococcales bacterium]